LISVNARPRIALSAHQLASIINQGVAKLVGAKSNKVVVEVFLPPTASQDDY
jgi:hypothetical protein